MKHSWLIYLLVFVLSLPVFLWIRWQPEPLVYSTMNRLKLNKVLHVESVGKHWLPGFRLQGVTVKLRKGPDIKLSHLDVSPVWWRLFLGTPALELSGESLQKSFSLVVSLSADKLEFLDVDINIDAKFLSLYIPQMALFPVQGHILLQGSTTLNKTSMQPERADIRVSIKQARLISGKTPQPLGNYEIRALSGEPGWIWSATGGENLLIDGKGSLKANSPDVTKWPISGQLKLTGKGQSGSLLKQITSHNPAQAKVSGILRKPAFNWSP